MNIHRYTHIYIHIHLNLQIYIFYIDIVYIKATKSLVLPPSFGRLAPFGEAVRHAVVGFQVGGRHLMKPLLCLQLGDGPWKVAMIYGNNIVIY